MIPLCRNRWVSAGLAALLGVGCASIKAQSDFDASTNFSAFETFAILVPEHADPPVPTQDIVASELIERRVERAVRAELEQRGLREVDAESADLLVAFSVGSRRAAEFRSYPDGPRPRGWWHDHWDSVYARIYTEGVLVVDLIDAESRHLVWRGWATDSISSRTDIDREVRDAVKAVFAEFPPASTAVAG